MKKIFSIAAAVIVASLSAMVYAGTPIRVADLPAAAQTFLSKHYSGVEVKKAEKDMDRRGVEYEVDLRNGAEIEFMADGQWKDVKAARGESVPAAIVPTAIQQYMTANYEKQVIVEISRTRGGYEVDLSNGMELKLTEDAHEIPYTRR